MPHRLCAAAHRRASAAPAPTPSPQWAPPSGSAHTPPRSSSRSREAVRPRAVAQRRPCGWRAQSAVASAGPPSAQQTHSAWSTPTPPAARTPARCRDTPRPPVAPAGHSAARASHCPPAPPAPPPRSSPTSDRCPESASRRSARSLRALPTSPRQPSHPAAGTTAVSTALLHPSPLQPHKSLWTRSPAASTAAR